MVKNAAMDASSQSEKRLLRRQRLIKAIALFAIWAVLILLYIPILTLIAYSFTTSTNIGTWMGFSLNLYKDLFQDEEIMTALGNTVILALTSSLCSVVLGTCGAIGTFDSPRSRWPTPKSSSPCPGRSSSSSLAATFSAEPTFSPFGLCSSGT